MNALRTPASRHEWLRRYGPAEVLALAASLTAYLLVEAGTGSRAAGAYAAALADSLAYYGLLVAREVYWRARSLRALLIEFGPAEALDVTIVRPACVAVATGALGAAAGVVVAKLVADLLFYIPVVSTYELTKQRRRAA